MAIETTLQNFLHAFDQGSAAAWVRRIIVATIVALIAMMWFVFKFNGFSVPDAMDQAQIGRQVAGGQGYTTLYVRPLAMHLGLARRGSLDMPLRDANQAPLGPLLNAAVFRISGMNFAFAPGEVVSSAERAITIAAFLFFAGSLVLTYLLGRRLFDPTLAMLAVGLFMLTDLAWRYTFSGLPQMAMLFFFNGALLALLSALEAGEASRRIKSVVFVLLASLLLSIVTLGHGVGLWIFAGFWLFAAAVIRPRWLVAIAAPIVYVAPLIPWAWHNWRTVRNPFGVPFYELYRAPGADPLGFIADFEPILRFKIRDFLTNTGAQAVEQVSHLFSFFGGSFVAGAFFLAVFLHVFRRWQPAQFRWAVLLMWFGAFVGMSVVGVEGAVSVNQLHIIFLPVLICYGMAFLLVLWSRLGFEQPLLRAAFLAILYFTAAIPLIGTVFTTPPRVNWPPYVPPIIARFGEWVGPKEAMASDIPWATAWYGGRLSLLLPQNIGQFEIIHSEGLLRAPLVGIYLTPFSGNQPAYSRIINGRYREWSRFVLREIKQEDLAGWMLRSAVNLPIDGETIFFADQPRWRR